MSVMVLQGLKYSPQKSRPLESGHRRHGVCIAIECSYKLDQKNEFKFLCELCTFSQIRSHFIPALTGQDPCSGLERELLALPCRLGGLNTPNPTIICEFQFSASKRISAPLASLILKQSDKFSIPCLRSVKSDIHQAKQQLLTSNSNDIKSHLDPTLQHTIDLLSVKCFSVWLTALPIQEQGFYLNKQEF